MKQSDLNQKVIQTDFNFPNTTEKPVDTNNEDQSNEIYTDKESMIRKQYELYIDVNKQEPSDTHYNTFKGAWDLCEVYMTQVLRYALANKDSLQNSEE